MKKRASRGEGRSKDRVPSHRGEKKGIAIPLKKKNHQTGKKKRPCRQKGGSPRRNDSEKCDDERKKYSCLFPFQERSREKEQRQVK